MFLEILTRHLSSRPTLLRRNQDSLTRQTCDDWQQTLLIDNEGRGVEWANGNLADYAPHLMGDYIWILDDDDYCTCDTLVEDLQYIATMWMPDAIMVRGDINRFGILPDDEHWHQPPVFSGIAMSNFLLRRFVWQRHASALTGPLGADYRMIRSVFDMRHYHIYWHDEVVMCSPAASWGQGE